MPGTNQTEYQGRTVEVKVPSGGTWRSFLWNPQNWINADQINEPGVYDGLNERIRRPQSGDKSYLDMARECFHQIHGLDDEREDTAFTKEHVEEALNRTYVGDQI